MKNLTIIIGGLGLIGKKVAYTFLNAGNNVEIWDIRDPNKDEKIITINTIIILSLN